MSNAKTYTVQPGNTLSAIGRHFGKTVDELKSYNNLSGDTIHPGQIIKLEADPKDLSFQVLFLDALRHPIEGLKYMLRFDGQEVKGQTAASGLGAAVQTQSFGSMVQVWVQRVDGTHKKLGEVASGFGEKLLTLVSPNLVFKVTPAKLPEGPQPEAKPKYSKDNPPPSKANGESIRPGHGAHISKGSAPGVVVLEVDIPEDLIAYFKAYKDEPIEEADWQTAADTLKCEVEVLKAFAEVESGGRSSYWRMKKTEGIYVPAILFERHLFHRLTKGKHDADPDISWGKGYAFVTTTKTLGSADQGQSDKTFDDEDAYRSYQRSYLRLLKAYRLDKEAALKSCSWGKFQILGNNHEVCEKRTVQSMVQTMSSGEKGQLELLKKFIKNNPAVAIKDASKKVIGYRKSLHQAVKDKDWHMMAFGYNGAGYEKWGYHTKMEAAYDRLKSKKAGAK